MGLSGKNNLPANAGETCLIPDSGRSHSHALEELNLSTTAIESVVWSLGAATTEPTHHSY